MADRHKCVDCGVLSPEASGEDTLISVRFGWRVLRYRAADGSMIVESRCPGCWREYKTSTGPTSSPPSAPSSGVAEKTPGGGLVEALENIRAKR